MLCATGGGKGTEKYGSAWIGARVAAVVKPFSVYLEAAKPGVGLGLCF